MPDSGDNGSPFKDHDHHLCCKPHQVHLEEALGAITTSLKRHRYKEALRGVMNVAQYGNQILQSAAPWKHLKEHQDGHEESLATLAFCWRVSRFLAITAQPFLPFSSQRLWKSLGLEGDVANIPWSEATNWDVELGWSATTPQPLFERLDLKEILAAEHGLVEQGEDESGVHAVKGGKKKRGKT